MPKFNPAPKPQRIPIRHGQWPDIVLPSDVQVQSRPDAPHILEVDLGLPGDVKIVLTIQGAVAVAQELRKAVQQYLHPEKTESGET